MILAMLKRAIRRLVAPMIMVCVLAGCSHSPQERTLSVSELIKADSDTASLGKRVQVTALVTYSDADWKVLFLEDRGASIYVKLPPGVVVQSGDRVQVFEIPQDLLVSGKPLGEPVAWYGPIVMNTQQQLQQAFEELDKGTFLKHTKP